MARHIQSVQLNKPKDFVNFIMSDFLSKNGFVLSNWKGESVYRAGDPLLEGYKFMKWSYDDNQTFHLEAWLTGPFGGEHSLEGFYLWAQKKPYKSSLESLIAVLNQPLPDQYSNMEQNGTQPDGNPASVVIPVQTVDNQLAATLSLVFGILTIVASCIPLAGLILGILGMTQARMGKCSSKAGMAKAGKICSIVGLCLAAVFYILNILVTSLGYV